MCLASPCFNDWFKRTPSCCKVNCDFKGVKNRMFFFQFRSRPKNAFYWPFHFKSFEFARSLLCLASQHLYKEWASAFTYTVYLNRERNVAFGVGQALLSCAKFIYEVA